MKERIIITLLISFMATAFIGHIMRIDVLHQVYEYSRQCVILNESDSPKRIPKEYLKIVLPPSIDGWQFLSHYEVLVNGKELNLRPQREEGNAIISIGMDTLYPAQILNISVTFEVKVTVAYPFLPLRRRIAIGELHNTLDEIPEAMRREYCVPFGDWRWNEGRNWEELRKIVMQIKGREDDIWRLVLSVISWVKEHVRYEESPSVLSPLETLKSGSGDCADQAVLVATMLRMIGVPAYVALAAYYDPEVRALTRGERIEVLEQGLVMHAFAMVYVPGHGWVPIDMTLRNARRPEDHVSRAAIVTSDRLVVLMTVVSEDPNDYLIYSVPNGLKVIMRVSLRKLHDPLKGLMILSGIFLASYMISSTVLILISKHSGTRRTAS